MAGALPIFEPDTPLPAIEPPALPFDSGITDIPDIQSFPDNGPNAVPGVPGPAPLGLYEYIVVPRQPPIPPNTPYFLAFTAYQQIEMECAMKSAEVQRIDLVNGTRVYRVPIQFLWRFAFDRVGLYIGMPPLRQWRFVLADPTLGMKAINDWLPVLG